MSSPPPDIHDPSLTLVRRFWWGLAEHGVRPRSRLTIYALLACVGLTLVVALARRVSDMVASDREARRYYHATVGKLIEEYLVETTSVRQAFSKILDVESFAGVDVNSIQTQFQGLAPHVERLNALQAEIGDSVWAVRAKLAQLRARSETERAAKEALCEFSRVHWQILVLGMNTKVARPMMDIFVSRDPADQIKRLESARSEWTTLETTLPVALESLAELNRRLN